MTLLATLRARPRSGIVVPVCCARQRAVVQSRRAIGEHGGVVQRHLVSAVLPFAKGAPPDRVRFAAAIVIAVLRLTIIRLAGVTVRVNVTVLRGLLEKPAGASVGPVTERAEHERKGGEEEEVRHP